MSVLLHVLGVTVMVFAVVVRTEGSKFKQPDWGLRSYLDEDFTLVCNHSDLTLEPMDFVRWELPSGQMVDSNSDKYELGVSQQVVNMHLTVRNVQVADSGVYLCHVYDQSQQERRGHAVIGLNLGGHLYHDNFDKYRHNLLVGGCVAAALLGLVLAGGLIHKFRYRSMEQRLASRNRRLEATKHQRYLAEVKKNGSHFSTTVASGDGAYINQAYGREQEESTTRM